MPISPIKLNTPRINELSLKGEAKVYQDQNQRLTFARRKIFQAPIVRKKSQELPPT